VPEAILTNCDIFKCDRKKKYGLYCVEHIYHEPKEAVARLEAKRKRKQVPRSQRNRDRARWKLRTILKEHTPLSVKNF